MFSNNEPIQVTLLVTNVLEELGVKYVLGGSLASALHGVARATMDADIIANFEIKHVVPFVNALKGAFYVDAEMIRDAIQHQMSFNIIHLETLFKVDIFVAKDRDFDRYQIERRTAYSLSGDTQQSVYVASAEDTILAKLEWYRMGGEVSDRQWRDILGIMKVQANKLDMDYLRKGSRTLQIEDLLDKAIKEAL